MKHHFVVSTGRTGTVAIARDINARARNAVAIHEPRPRTWTRIASNLAMDSRISRDTLSAVWSAAGLFRGHMRSPLVVESNSLIPGFVPWLADRYPNARFLHVVRDPRDFVCSALNFGAIPTKRFVKGRVLGWELASVKNGVAEDMKRLGAADWHSREALRIAHRWAAVNRFLADAGEALDGRYRVAKFEKLFGDELDTYEDCLQWLGVVLGANNAGTIPRHNRSEARYIQSFCDLPRSLRKAIIDICEPVAERVGYEL